MVLELFSYNVVTGMGEKAQTGCDYISLSSTGGCAGEVDGHKPHFYVRFPLEICVIPCPDRLDHSSYVLLLLLNYCTECLAEFIFVVQDN